MSISSKNCLPFGIIENCYIPYSKDTKYYDIYFGFDSIERQKFYDLTNKSSDIKFLTDNEYAKLGTVTNNTLVQVTSIVGPKDLLDQIKKEIKQQKS